METQRTPADFFAARVRDAQPSPTLAVSDRARQLKAEGIDVIDLGGGDPDFITPEHIRQAAIEAMNGGDTHYVASSGTPAFRKAIAAKLEQDNGITVDPAKEVLVTPGGKAALFQAAMAFVEPGVDVMILEPAWVSYTPMVELAGGRAVHVGLDPDANFAVTREILERHHTPASRIILINSPSNPTGRVLSDDELTIIADFAKERDLLVFTDEMYEKIIFDGHRHTSIATLPGMAERTLTFNGLSKAYAMTGWRLGYVAGPAAFISEIAKVHSHSVTCATSFAQAGGVAALNGPQAFIGEMVGAWDRRRKLITDGLNGVQGLRVPTIEGAFYAFVDGRETGLDSITLSDRILTEAHVAVVPGVAFGDCGEGHFRLSFATSDEALAASVARIRDLLGAR
ncbi:MAG TPA: pyridoxal phosphate-dependent aminotransferase [Thermomicrobiales bacterium]|nr:pyridoxal phosphate-dependent aminotransferase [Thermomicrobiales bacterium]